MRYVLFLTHKLFIYREVKLILFFFFFFLFKAANVGFGRVFSLVSDSLLAFSDFKDSVKYSKIKCYGLQAKPDAGKLVIGTIALLIASTTNLLVVCLISPSSIIFVFFHMMYVVDFLKCDLFCVTAKIWWNDYRHCIQRCQDA